MDREIPKSVRSKASLKKVLFWLIIISIAVLGYYGLKKLLTRSADPDSLVFAKVERGDIENRITASGRVVPYYERVINAPVATEIKSVFLSTGDQVRKGDIIMELDQEYTRLDYDQSKDQLEVRRNNLTKLKLEFDKNLRDLEYRNQIKGLEVKELKAQVIDQKRLKDIGGATTEEVEKAELQLNIAELEKKILENELDYRQKSNDTEKENLELEFKIQEKKLRELQRKLKETTVSAAEDGVITWINEDLGQKLQEGEEIVKIANLDRFKIDASTSDRYTSQLSIGMPVKVRIENKEVDGIISNILPAVENNTLKFTVTIDDRDSHLLRPNMRVEVFILTDKKEDVLRIRNGAAFSGANNQDVFVIRDNVAHKLAIRIGLRNSEFVEVSGNIQAGDELIISDIAEFQHMDRFNIKNPKK